MQTWKIARAVFISILATSLAGLVGISPASAAVTKVPQINLCLAGSYATLSNVLTNAAGVIVRSDTPGTLIGASSPVETDGFLHPGDNLVSQQSGADYTAAMGSLRTAIDSVKTNILPYAIQIGSDSLATAEVIPGQLGVFPAGIYSSTAAMSIAANQHITLTGDADSVFVFISGEAFNVGANVQILLSGGAQAKNVYWVIGTFVGAHTAGASSTLVGNYLVDGTMSVGASTHLTGRILAMNTITFGAEAHLDALPPATSCGASVMSDTKTIEFTDTTLVDGTRGQVYSDFVAARTLLNGSANSQTVTYSVSPSMAGLGLSMDSAGVVTGTVSNTATVGTYSFTVSATSVGYVTQNYVYPLVIKAAGVSDAKTIEFTETTLVDGTKGQVYSDFIAARTLLNGNADSQTITHSISPSMDYLGLSMDSAGIVTGTILDTATATAGTHVFTVTATSLGYVTQTYVHELVIKVAAVVPPVVVPPAVVPPVAVPPVAVPTTSTYVTIKLSVNFESGSSKLSGAQKAKLLRFISEVSPKITDGIVVGYVQRTGNTSNDRKLSAARALVIAKFLAAHGVKAPLLTEGNGVLNGTKAARVSTISLRYKKQ